MKARLESIQVRLLLLTGVVFASTFGYGAYALHTLSAVKVNGPYYQRISANRELLADVLPPPGYVVEPYLKAHLMARAATPAALENQVARYEQLKLAYFRRLDDWRRDLPDAPLKSELVEVAREPAEAFFAAIDRELVPALRRGDRPAADRVLEITLPPLFAAHRAAIDRVVALAQESARADEAEVARLIDTRRAFQTGFAVLYLAAAAGLAAGIAVSVRRRAARFRALIENSSEAIALYDARATILYNSPSAEQMFGYPTNELDGRNALEFVHPDDAPEVARVLGSVRTAPKQVVRTEVRVRHRAGGYRWVEIVGANHLDDPAVGAIVANIRDTTARRVYEERLRERDAVLQKLSDLVPGVIFQYREYPDGRACVPYASEGLRAVFGVAPAEVSESAEPITRQLHPDDAERVVASIRRSAEALAPWHDEYRVILPDQRTRWCESRSAPERLPDGSVLWHGHTADVTDRKAGEARQGELVRELERRNTEMEQFTYTVSHDLKSPLVTIKGFLGALEHDLGAGDTSRAATDMARIGTAADRMMALLDDLLNLSRVGRVARPPEPVSLADVVREARERVDGPARAAGARVHIDAHLPPVMGDRDRLVEVFQNLLENALKYGGPAPVIEVRARPDPLWAVCAVRDHGIGLDPRHHERIFGLFEKLDPKSPGTGVGLALVRKIVASHGGRAWVESDGPGTGSTFLVALPAPGTETAPKLAPH
ncbi:PAS domain S-box protein [Gemmata sp. G18]|uniref:histidine kinase n=1 Tax=Gemmata palustris TaxID=2822762 RepID=A0ABS5BNP8_9BACT|nr:PAS domain-containing sensor histidine kinase [Gemmata palustris]MBP3955092.1 PAS domain S-box protein [Gemmata palustris]